MHTACIESAWHHPYGRVNVTDTSTGEVFIPKLQPKPAAL